MWLFFLKNPGDKKMHPPRLCVCAVLKLSPSCPGVKVVGRYTCHATRHATHMQHTCNTTCNTTRNTQEMLKKLTDYSFLAISPPGWPLKQFCCSDFSEIGKNEESLSFFNISCVLRVVLHVVLHVCCMSCCMSGYTRLPRKVTVRCVTELI